MKAEVARPAMAATYRALSQVVGGLGEDDLARWSRCRGWTRADVLFHTLLDAQRALVTFATPVAGEPDVDFVSYWEPFRPGEAGAAEHARFVRRVAASYPSNLAVARQWAETAAAAVHAAGALPADLRVATQGHVLAIGDFLATLAVEATIHHLDLLAADGDPGGPSADGLAAVRMTLDGICGGPAPAAWDDVTYALKGTGRAALTPGDHSRLGPLAARFPLLG
jgi:uncharacterized protein (TIGR03083 family)